VRVVRSESTERREIHEEDEDEATEPEEANRGGE
jgi:hypothetical protein